MSVVELADALAVGALVVAVGSFVVAALASSRAKKALDLQKQVDDRQREFREVAWSGKWVGEDEGTLGNADIRFRLTNTGLTPAVDVTLIIDFPTGSHTFELGKIGPSESREASMAGVPESGLQLALFKHRRFRVHWSSPLGAVDTAHFSDPQIF